MPLRLPPELSDVLRAHAATLHGLLSDDSITAGDARFEVRRIVGDLLALADGRGVPSVADSVDAAMDAAVAEAIQRAAAERIFAEAATGGFRRLPPRLAAVPTVPRPAAEVLPFRRATGASVVPFARETTREDA